MQTLTRNPDLFAYPLSHRQAARILEQAVRTRARVTLQPHTPIEGPELTGQLVTKAPESFCIELDDLITVVPQALTSICCDAHFHIGQDRYLFDTNIMAVIDTDLPTRLEIARPETVHTMQRRRFRRSEIRGSAPIELHNIAGDANAAGTLLNASMDGIACRIATASADRTNIGDIIRVSFKMADCPHPFDLDVVVRSKTPAGSEHQTIVGLQFAFRDGDSQQRRRLAEVLGFAPSNQQTSRNHDQHAQRR